MAEALHSPADIAQLVWESKYRAPGECSLADSWRRVARAIAATETTDRERWAQAFERLLSGYRFLPGGRILAGAGTDREVTLFNCFVMGVIEDSLEGIFDALKAGAVTMQQGGGIGYDFSTLRPAGTRAQRTGAIASGPVSFMRIWDAMCATMLSTGARRGAMMATLRCDHPDIETFIDAKREPGELRNFNLSVQVSDAFLQAVDADADWPLLFPLEDGETADQLVQRRWTGDAQARPCRVVRVLPARRLWERLLRAAYDVAEPGVLFIDQINRENNLRYCEQITATNPCGELPLPPYGACNLGSLNLTRFVQGAFTARARLDFEALREYTALAVRFLDDVIDASRFPLPVQAETVRASRRLGLGVTGLADALIMLGQAYDSDAARDTARSILRQIRDQAYATSIELARERGRFPCFERDAYLASPYIRRLPGRLRDAIARHGLRNSHLLAIAPAGTISLLAHNVSSGIEPVFALDYERRVLQEDGSARSVRVEDHAWRLWQDLHPGEAPPPAFREATGIAPRAHLAMQAELQPFVDNAISKTINVAADCPFEDFADVYHAAHRAGLKGCTVFRPNPVRAAVLSREPVHCCDLEREAD
ncbi:MAG: adenosylcobalamin-dependent ribonucleoside-diphosphate reductase [Gammaproteobacteria bacterium]|nr:MAG: adenosylcobalamin-dependent ribonucleoside-diphosphate reductase [Gammaproteobacteria bacterium]